MRRYPEYKDSGMEFIGDIPAHWESKRLGQVSTIFKGGTPRRNVDRYFQGDLPWARPVDITALKGALYINDTEIHISEEALGNSGARRLPAGTVLLTSRATIGETAITTVPMATNQGFANFVCNERLLNIHLVYYLQAIKDLLISLGSGSTFLEVTKGTLVGVKIPLPPFSEQTQIANFLDRKTGQIDELIRIKERLLELLHEQRTVLINEVVTKGLDPNAEMKPSGVEWIGEIPKHWTMTRLKYISSIPVTYGLNIEADKYTTEGIRLIRITDIDENGGIRPKGVYLSEDCVPQEQMLNSYDLLLARSGATVGKSYLHLEEGKYTSAGYLVRFNFSDYWTSKFIYYVTLSHFYRNWLEQQIIVSTIQNVNGEKYSNFQIPIPLHQERKQIANFLDHKTGQIDELISAEQRKVELLKEYRQSLIFEAVTGKIDVRVDALAESSSV